MRLLPIQALPFGAPCGVASVAASVCMGGLLHALLHAANAAPDGRPRDHAASNTAAALPASNPKQQRNPCGCEAGLHFDGRRLGGAAGQEETSSLSAAGADRHASESRCTWGRE